MYTAVLMLTLTSGADSMDFGRRGHGCSTSHATCSSPYAGQVHRGCSSSHGCTVNRGMTAYPQRGCSGYYQHGCHGTSSCNRPYGYAQYPIGIHAMPHASATAAQATIVVNLPADAKLTVDGALTRSTEGRRTLVTPALEVGASYSYTLRAEVVRKGQTIAESKEVTVRAGEVSAVQFRFPSEAIASK